jgi:hypothetical protein
VRFTRIADGGAKSDRVESISHALCEDASQSFHAAPQVVVLYYARAAALPNPPSQIRVVH